MYLWCTEHKEQRDRIYEGASGDTFSQDKYESEEHEANWGIDAVGGAVGFEAMKKFEDKRREEGKPVSHEKAKEFLAGLVSAEITNLVQTKGMDAWDRRKQQDAEQKGVEQAHRIYDEQYQNNGREEWHP